MKLRKQTGVAAVELALILVPLLVLCFGIVEVGRALNYYNGLVKASRGAARYLTGKNLADSAEKADAVKIAKWLAVCSAPLPSSFTNQTCPESARLVPGLSESKVAVTTYTSVPTVGGSISLVTVTISGVQFTSFLPYSIASFPFFPVTLTMAWSVT